MWQGFLDLRDRVGKVEGTLMILVPLVVATFLLTLAQTL